MARLGQSGEPAWITNLAGDTLVSGSVLALAAGNPSVEPVIFAAGKQKGPTGPSMGLTHDAAIWKVDNLGNVAWTGPYLFGSDSDDEALAIATNEAGDAAYVAASIGDNAKLPNCGSGNADLSWLSGSKAVVAKLDGAIAPDCQWAVNFEGSAVKPVGIAVDIVGTSYVALWFSGSISVPGVGLYTTSLATDYATVLVSLLSSGSVSSAKMYAATNGNESLTATAMAMSESQGRIYIVGSLKGLFQDGSSVTATTPGDTDAIVLALGLDGSVQWAKRIGGSAVQYATSIAIAPDGLYVSGITLGALSNATDSATDALCIGDKKCAFLMRLDWEGNAVSTQAFGKDEPTGDAALHVAADKDQLVLVGGWSEAINFGNDLLPSTGALPNQDVVVARFSPLP